MKCCFRIRSASAVSGERGPVRHGGAERRVQFFIGLQIESLRHACVYPGEQFRIAKAGRGPFLPALALREGAKRIVTREAHVRVAHDQGLQCVPDAALPIDQRSVAVEREDTVVGQSAHSLVAISCNPRARLVYAAAMVSRRCLAASLKVSLSSHSLTSCPSNVIETTPLKPADFSIPTIRG